MAKEIKQKITKMFNEADELNFLKNQREIEIYKIALSDVWESIEENILSLIPYSELKDPLDEMFLWLDSENNEVPQKYKDIINDKLLKIFDMEEHFDYTS